MTKQTPALPTDGLRFWMFLTLAFFVFIYLISSVLLPFVLGMAMAYFLDPLADKLQRRGWSRTNSTLMIIGVFFSLIIMMLILTVPIIAGQLAELITMIPAYAVQIDQTLMPYIERKLRMLPPSWMAEVKSSVASSSGMIARTMVDFLGGALTSGFAFLNLMSLVLITPIVAFYLLRDWDRIVARIDSLIPPRHSATVHEQLRQINITLAGFVRGQLNVCLLLGLYYAIGLSLAGLNFGFLIGLATGFLIIFPYVGPFVGMLTGLTIAFFQFGEWAPVLVVLAVFASGQLIEGNFITPKLVGDKVGLHPVWIIFAMLAGAALFGFVGILLAIPVAAVLGVLTRFAVLRYRESHYFQ